MCLFYQCPTYHGCQTIAIAIYMLHLLSKASKVGKLLSQKDLG